MGCVTELHFRPRNPEPNQMGAHDEADDVRSHHGIGVAIGPILVGLLMGTLGYWSFFTFLLATHLALAASARYRMVVRAAPGIDEQEPFVMLSRTSQSALSMVRDAAVAIFSHEVRRFL